MGVNRDLPWWEPPEKETVKKRIYSMALETIELPEAMHKELKEEAKCKATEALIMQIAQMSSRQLERVQLFPQKLLRKIPEIPLEKISLISRILARSLIIDTTKAVVGAADCELNTHFLHNYTLNLFSYEPMGKAIAARQWYLEHQFTIHFDMEMARNQHLMVGINDAIDQGRESGMQLLCVKAGFNVNEIHSLFPRHVRRRFSEMQFYCRENNKLSSCNEASQDRYSYLLEGVGNNNSDARSLSFNTIDKPESMRSELKDAAQCKAAEDLLKLITLMTPEQLERSNIFPSKLLMKISSIPVELIPLISRRFARSLVIDRVDAGESSTDCEFSTLFFHSYVLNLFKYEPMMKAVQASEWFIANGFSIRLDIGLAIQQRLMAGIKDAIIQGKESFLQMHCIKAGFTIDEIHSIFPKHVKGRFVDMQVYCNDFRDVGSNVKVYDDDSAKKYLELVGHHYANTGDVLESKLLAYNDVIIGEELPYPITSYEQLSLQ